MTRSVASPFISRSIMDDVCAKPIFTGTPARGGNSGSISAKAPCTAIVARIFTGACAATALMVTRDSNALQIKRRLFTCDLPSGPADALRTTAAAAECAVADELLNAFAGIHFARVEVARAVQADLVQPVEI